MALITFSGYPSSGKSMRALQLQELLQNKQSLPVLILSDESLNIPRNVYDSVFQSC